MNIKTVAICVLTLATPAWALCAPVKPLSVVQSVAINAPVEKVWEAVKDFDALDKWHPGFSKDVITKGQNGSPGAVRALTVKDGPTFTEELLAFNPAKHSYRYRIIESPLPVDHYVSIVHVSAGKNGTTRIVWSAKFTRKNPSDNPPPAENDEAAVKLITGVFQAGLANLKKQNES
jgi:uncharacterized protein YndB with AHSA1/START domain